MALLFMDGFDHYASADITKKWTATSGSATITSNGRRSTSSLSLSSGTCYKTLPSTYSTLIVGFALDLNSATMGGTDCLRLYEGGTTTIHISLRVNADLSISVMRGGQSGTVLQSTSAAALTASGFNYIELKANIHDSTGSYTLKINGAQVLTATGVDTRNSGTSGVLNTVYFFQSPATAARFDDVYVCDTSGSAPNNDFLGDCRVDTLLPNADGTYTQFTPSTGTDHYALVDETTPNTSDHNESSTAGHKDSYNMQNLSAITGTIYGVQVLVAALKDDAGARSLKVGVRSSTTDSVDAGTALTTGQLYYRRVLEQDPATTAAWTESGVNAAQALVEVL